MPEDLLPAPKAPTLSGCTLILDDSAQEISSGLWAGGTPLRLLRLSKTAEALLDDLLAGIPSEGSGAALARRLVDSGMAHPRFDDSPFGQEDLTVVIPTRDRSGELDALLWRLAPLRCLVVDDASNEPLALARVCAAQEPGPPEPSRRCPPGRPRPLAHQTRWPRPDPLHSTLDLG